MRLRDIFQMKRHMLRFSSKHTAGCAWIISGICRSIACAILYLPAGAATAQHWAFQRPIVPAVPRVKQARWVKNPVDAFVLNKLEERGLSPSQQSDKRTLLRRVTFDLTGLPPTSAEIAEFVADDSAGAYEIVVARLLNSKHFGERWAQHWLDVVRFGESNGYEHDLDRPQAWRYRDWVVDALNADKPFDRFIREQVAGDLLAPNDFNSRVATGFLRTGPYHITGGNLDPAEMRQEWLTEAVAGIGNGILGLTINCARCHDHKFDPIPQTDYYRLQAFFVSAANLDETRATAAEKQKFEAAVKAIKERAKPIDAQIAAIEKPYRVTLREQKRQALAPEYKAALAVDAAKRTPAEKKLASESSTQLNLSWDEVVNALRPDDRAKRSALRQQIFAIEREMPGPLPEAQGVADGTTPAPAMRLLVRGDVHNPGPVVSPGFPACIAKDEVAQTNAGAENPRLSLARWLSSPENALTSRVFVNRIWHSLFGRGLVATPNDFGRNGLAPTHPELLDWLATSFAKSRIASQSGSDFGCDWSVKSIIHLLVTSNTYRQACQFDSAKAVVDPDNRLLWRMNRKRLDAESLRDSILATVGTLNLEIGGPSVRIPLEPEVYDTIFTEFEPDNLWPTTPDPRQHTRRSLYLFRKRNVRLPMLAIFDQPDMMSSCAARGQTVHALQALTLVNSEFMRKQSYLVARRILADTGSRQSAGTRARVGSRSALEKTGDRDRIERLFVLALGRPPHADELKSTERFLGQQTALIRSRIARKEPVAVPADLPSQGDLASYIALSDLCLATLNLNEFMYLR